MNTRNHLPGLAVGIVLLAGCQSLTIPQKDAPSEERRARVSVQPPVELAVDPVPEPVVQSGVQPAMTIPRPHPPSAEPPALGAALPEPAVAGRSAAAAEQSSPYRGDSR